MVRPNDTRLPRVGNRKTLAEKTLWFPAVVNSLQGFRSACVGWVMKAIKTIATLSLVTACTAVEAPPASQPEPPAAGSDQAKQERPIDPTMVPMPATCAAIAASQPGAADGEYTLYFGGDIHKPWLAYCADMAMGPSEYLPLVAVLGDHNFSQYTAGGASPGTSVRTSYMRLRIDPVTLAVDIGDQRFATSSGGLNHSFSEPVSSMPFGVAMSCDGTASGLANIDLRGTEFTLASTFQSFGAGGAGGAMVSSDLQQADLTGGGSCGWTGTPAVPFNPFNAAHGWVLQLAFKS